MVMLLQKI